MVRINEKMVPSSSTDSIDDQNIRSSDILKEFPYCYVISTQCRSEYCSFCFKKSQHLLRCSRCKFLYFCDSGCQRSGWPDHREECSCLEDVRPKIPTDMGRLMARIIFKRRSSPDSGLEGEYSNSDRKFEDLMSHREEISKDPLRVEHLSAVSLVLKDYIGAAKLPKPRELVEIFGKIVVNAFSILNRDLNPVGTGLYLRFSVLDHSCNPDAVITFDGPMAILRPVKRGTSITKTAGNFLTDASKEVRMSYIDLLATTEERKRQLRDQYYFDCSCDYCTDSTRDQKMQAFTCTDSNCDGYVLYEPSCAELSSCMKCRKVVPNVEENIVCLQNVKWKLEEFEKLKKLQDFAHLYEECKEFLKYVDGFLHDLNIFKVRLLDLLMDACIELEKWGESTSFGMRTLKAYSAFYPENPNLALQLTKVGKLLCYESDLEEAERILQQALSVSEVCYGKDSLFYSECWELLTKCQEERRIVLNNQQKVEN